MGDFETGLDWAEIAIAQGQQTPDHIKRDFPHFVADTVLEWADLEAERGNAVEPWFSRVFNHVRQDWRLNEQLTAKWFKAAGLLKLRDEGGKPATSAISDPAALEAADQLLEQAEQFHAAIGVKTLRQRIAMRLRALEMGRITSYNVCYTKLLRLVGPQATPWKEHLWSRSNI